MKKPAIQCETSSPAPWPARLDEVAEVLERSGSSIEAGELWAELTLPSRYAVSSHGRAVSLPRKTRVANYAKSVWGELLFLASDTPRVGTRHHGLVRLALAVLAAWDREGATGERIVYRDGLVQNAALGNIVWMADYDCERAVAWVAAMIREGGVAARANAEIGISGRFGERWMSRYRRVTGCIDPRLELPGMLGYYEGLVSMSRERRKEQVERWMHGG